MRRTSDGDQRRVIVRRVSKDFTLRHTHSIKETFVAALRRRPLASRFHALNDVTIEIDEGEAVALLGFNGSGKSTTLKMISGVLRPDAGEVLTRGRVAGLIEVGAGFHPDLSGRENIFLNAAILGMNRKETEERFDDIVAFSEIEQFIDTEVKHYSSGMFLRLAFAVAIHTEVDVLLIDEILSVGDEPFQRKCLARIRELHAEGKTLVVVSHDLNMVARLCQRGIVLKDGRVVFDGPSFEAVRALRDLSQSPMVDVQRDHPYFDEILEVVDSGALPVHSHTSGRGEFRPEEPVTLGSLAMVLRAFASSPGPTSAPLPGTGTTAVEAEAVAWLEAVVGGSWGDAHSRATDFVTRADVAVAMYSLARPADEPSYSYFADVDDDDEYATAVGWMARVGIARGWERPDGLPSYQPSSALTREAMVVMLTRFRTLVDGRGDDRRTP